jgi:prophage regulatory protein
LTFRVRKAINVQAVKAFVGISSKRKPLQNKFAQASYKALVNTMAEKILRTPTVLQMIGLSRTTVWRMERAGTFPTRRKISSGTVGWFESEVLTWIAEREKVEPR